MTFDVPSILNIHRNAQRYPVLSGLFSGVCRQLKRLPAKLFPMPGQAVEVVSAQVNCAIAVRIVPFRRRPTAGLGGMLMALDASFILAVFVPDANVAGIAHCVSSQ